MTATKQSNLVIQQAQAAQAVAPELAVLSTAKKNAILLAAAEALVERSDEVIAANQRDIDAGREAGMADSLIDRLSLDRERIDGIADGLRQVAGLKDPVGEVLRGSVMPNGIHMKQIRVPLGVMGMVYEARPNVTADAFGLAIKSGNVPLLRGSKSARNSNTAIVTILQDVCENHGLPRETVQLLPCETHDSVHDLITARGLVDVVIPRGSARLIEAVVSGATVPAIETGTGNCHVYVHEDAEIQQATDIVINGKTRRPSVCNATETVLLSRGLAHEDAQYLLSKLIDAGVTLHGDPEELAAYGVEAVAAGDSDWAEEYLSLDIAVAFVDDFDAAVSHIERWSTGHTEAIVTTSHSVAQAFADRIDAAAVMINASTAFTDGEVYGMGAEIGISTQKLHARGPMALPELTSTKWILEGTGQTRP